MIGVVVVVCIFALLGCYYLGYSHGIEDAVADDF